MRRIGSALIVAGGALWLCGPAACVDSQKHVVAVDAGTIPDGLAPLTCQGAAPGAYAGDAGIPAGDTAAPGAYAWKNVVIKGGGFVSGLVVSPALQGLAFARTDVGGAYRFDPTNQRWSPVTDWVGHNNSNLIGIESIALDPVDPNRVYIAAGEYLTAGNGVILSSTDMGRTWTQNNIQAPMGGNVDGRSVGERLAVDPNLPSTLYFGSRNAGLWMSGDSAKTWTQVTSFPTTGATGGGAGSASGAGTGYGLTFVLFDASSGMSGSATPAIYVGVGVTTGPSLYRSTDAGATWTAIDGQPNPGFGLMPAHGAPDGCGNIYFIFNNASGPNNVSAGSIWRYSTAVDYWTNVTPPSQGHGFGGLAADAAHPGTLLATTIDWWAPDRIYRTTNGGTSWIALANPQYDIAGADWLYFGKSPSSLSATGWMSAVAIDPFDPGHALYNTGQGLWSSDDVTMADAGAPTSWTFQDDGLEETVALDLASPPAGPPLLSGVGDLGGFRHDDLTVSPANGMFTNPVFGNTTSLDFSEAITPDGSAPALVARVGTGGSTNGAYATDGGTLWTPFVTAPSGSTGSGSIAVSADGATLVWAPKKGTPSYSIDNGTTWTMSAGLGAGALVAADRVNPQKFYASGRNAMLVSTDGGKTFVSVATPSSGRPRPVFGVEGDLWVPTGSGLLHSQDSGATYTSVGGVYGATALGFGAPVQPAQTYPSVYIAATVGSTSAWGTYRSDDAGVTWQRIDDPQHQFGYLNCLAGDRRQPGRVYLGTSGRGIVYGDPLPAAGTESGTE
ncbi:MAG TPA: carbohydrate-binding protein [Polyangia bacterium]|nr:carbohydrate-binding protein [Polyangia bacterium]